MKGSIQLFLCVIAVFCFGGGSVFAPAATIAQVSNGSISGNIADPQGSGVPQATVKATNKATNQELTTTSDSSGLFRLGVVPPGTYRIEISKQGFRKAVFDNVEVAVGADRGLGTVRLEIGEVTSMVEVNSAFRWWKTQKLKSRTNLLRRILISFRVFWKTRAWITRSDGAGCCQQPGFGLFERQRHGL